METHPRYLRTDERLDTEGSLRKAAQTVALVQSDPSEWKWVLIAVHSAVQGMFVLALSVGNNLLTLRSDHAAAWLKAYRSGGPYPDKLDLAYFGVLYRRAKEHSKFLATHDHDKAIEQLNELRNNFIHFGAKGWSIQLAGLPTICLSSLEIVEHRSSGEQTSEVSCTGVQSCSKVDSSSGSPACLCLMPQLPCVCGMVADVLSL